MISEREVWTAANLIGKRDGADAEIEAARRGDRLEADQARARGFKGTADGCALSAPDHNRSTRLGSLFY